LELCSSFSSKYLRFCQYFKCNFAVGNSWRSRAGTLRLLTKYANAAKLIFFHQSWMSSLFLYDYVFMRCSFIWSLWAKNQCTIYDTYTHTSTYFISSHDPHYILLLFLAWVKKCTCVCVCYIICWCSPSMDLCFVMINESTRRCAHCKYHKNSTGYFHLWFWAIIILPR